MPHVLFADSKGSPFQSLGIVAFEQLLCTKRESYWNSGDGSGNSSVHYMLSDPPNGGTPTASIDFTLLDEIGVHLCHVQRFSDRSNEYHYAIDGDNFSQMLDTNYAGGIRRVARALFIPLNDAIKVFKVFFKDGSRSSQINWLSSGKVPSSAIENP